ncbi:hypothetical protein ACFV2D_31115 [Streptomyces capillispiralis]|uniref:hypothetical protein n=1 Tax=Streptomyces capillispiralis TaxID=68182 RepID=UPI0036CC57D6
MSEQPGRRDPKLARTDFESMSHEQLAALLDSASPEGASQLAAKLSKASSTITKIGDDLMTYVKGLEWQGEGGDAFRDWGGQSAAATLRLGEYAEVASRWMATVAQAVAEAKAALPDTSETTRAEADLADARKTLAAAEDPSARNDPEARKLAQTAQSDAAAAQQRMEAARAEAVQQLRKLAQTYEYSAHQVNSVPPPTFSPPSMHVDAPWGDTTSEHVSAGVDGTSRTTPTASAYTANYGSVGPAANPSASRPPTEPVTPTANSTRHDAARSAAMEIDGITTPQTTTPSVTTAHGPQTSPPRSESTSVLQPGPVAPPLGGGNGAVRSITTPTSPVTRLPMPSSQGISSGTIARSPRDMGIVGGRPISSNPGRPSGSIPRGTVIGGGSVPGNTPMVRGVGAAPVGGGSVVAGQTGGVGGRRLASETGGVVGSHPTQRGGSPVRPFTPGGSGLIRPSSSTGTPTNTAVTGRTARPQHTHPSSSRSDEHRGQRPDYLVEEEETWSRGNRRGLPPVVD